MALLEIDSATFHEIDDELYEVNDRLVNVVTKSESIKDKYGLGERGKCHKIAANFYCGSSIAEILDMIYRLRGAYTCVKMSGKVWLIEKFEMQRDYKYEDSYKINLIFTRAKVPEFPMGKNGKKVVPILDFDKVTENPQDDDKLFLKEETYKVMKELKNVRDVKEAQSKNNELSELRARSEQLDYVMKNNRIAYEEAKKEMERLESKFIVTKEESDNIKLKISELKSVVPGITMPEIAKRISSGESVTLGEVMDAKPVTNFEKNFPNIAAKAIEEKERMMNVSYSQMEGRSYRANIKPVEPSMGDLASECLSDLELVRIGKMSKENFQMKWAGELDDNGFESMVRNRIADGSLKGPVFGAKAPAKKAGDRDIIL